MASASNAGAMSADDKQTVETLKRRMSEIVTSARTEPRGKNVKLLLDKLGSGQAATVSLPGATTELAGVMTAKDKKKVEKPYKKLVVGRAISLKARKGMRYFFADGKVKIRYNSRHLKEFPGIKEILMKQGMEDFAYGSGEGYYYKKEKKAQVIVTITGEPPITLEKIKIEGFDKGHFSCLETASPFLFIRDGVIARNCPFSTEEAIIAIRDLYKAKPEIDRDRHIHIQPRGFVIRRRVRATLYHKKPWKKKKNVWKLIRTSKRFHGIRVKIWKKHRRKKCPNCIELHVRIANSGKHQLAFKPI